MSNRGEPKQAYPDVMVARIKGAIAAGIPHKLVSHLSGASRSTVSHYSSGTSRKNVKPDPCVIDRLRDWLHGA